MEYLRHEHLELIQKNYTDLQFKSQTFARSDIDNCELDFLEFHDCCFDRSSLTCIRAKKCLFDSCKFRNVDLLSCNLVSCTFQNCDFSLANIGDATFHQCSFFKSDFTAATIKNNEFLYTQFDNISLRGSVTSLNTFRKSTIQNSEFGNCTVDYNIVEDCSFFGSYLNIETFGTFFGLDLSNIHDCKFLSLGQQSTVTDIERLMEIARRQFKQDGRHIESFILDLNRSLDNLIAGTESLCACIHEKVLSGRYVPVDQLSFLFNVFKELYHRKMLGFYPLNRFMEGIRTILNDLPPDNKCYERFVLLYNDFGLLSNSMIADFKSFSGWSLYKPDSSIVVRMHFHEKPSMPIVEILESCHLYVFGEKPSQTPIVLAEKAGSYIVYIEAAMATLLAFRLGAFLLVGGVKDLVRVRANLSLLTSKKLPRKFYLEAIKQEPDLKIPPEIAMLMPTLLKGPILKILGKVPGNDISDNNLEEIQEVTKEEASSENHSVDK